jgi:AcrR family transcriptional regulator
VAGEPASKRALRSQGRKTMRKLLDAAMTVFSRRGYHAARVDDIVKVARTSHGTFYLYFSNKEDLLRALVAEAGEVVASLDDALGPVSADEEGWKELRRWMEQFSDAWQRYAPVLQAWTDLVMSDAELSEQARLATAGVTSTLSRRIAEAGPIAGLDPNAASEAVIAMVDRFHYLRQWAGEPVDAAAIDTLTTMVHRALFSRAPSVVGSDSSRRTVRTGPGPTRSGAARSRS